MTMTTPACPLHSYLSDAAAEAIRDRIPEAKRVSVEIVWQPKWNPMMMSEAAKRQLGWQ
jgi:metal-sulfur cluster biosynthetic enzyme